MTASEHDPPAASDARRSPSWLRLIGPGILVAATGVGTGDLVTGALTGGKVGVAVLWAAVVGAAFKFVLNEGLARWQLVTGETVLEGIARYFGRLAVAVFLGYLVLWSYAVAAALMSACGVALHAMLPLGDADRDKIVYGIAHSIVAVGLVEWGGYRLFERVMRVCIGLMFVTVIITAVAVQPDWGDVLRGLMVPSLPDWQDGGMRWTVALMGGVGGTVTILCYGYWIREEGRDSVDELRSCRIDLAVGYTMTALFGVAMVIIGSQIVVVGESAGLLVAISNGLAERLGRFAQWTFLIGAWGAIFSSLLGVWQSVPYLFADVVRLLRADSRAKTVTQSPAMTRGPVYRIALFAMASVPIIGLFEPFEGVQLAYAICGAFFIPLLAIALLLLNGSARRINSAYRNRPLTTITLFVAVLMFVLYGYLEVRRKLG